MAPPVDRRRLTDRRAGFNLILLSIIMTAAALVYVTVLGDRAENDLLKSQSTTQKLQKVEQAMTGFMALNGQAVPGGWQYGGQ